MTKGKLIIISAPSGCGKSTIIGEIIKKECLNLAFSISATTRTPRGEEIDGVNYYFLSEEEFKQAIANDELVEYEEVYPGRYYGTLKKEVERICNSGKNVILDIDVKGGINVKKQYGEKAVSIFIMPPSVDVLRERLESRATDTPEAIAERVGKAEYEISFAEEFDYRIVNDKLAEAVKETEQIIIDFVL